MNSKTKLMLIGIIFCSCLADSILCSAQKSQSHTLKKVSTNDTLVFNNTLLFHWPVTFKNKPSKNELKIAEDSIRRYLFQIGQTDTSSITINWLRSIKNNNAYEVSGEHHCQICDTSHVKGPQINPPKFIMLRKF